MRFSQARGIHTKKPPCASRSAIACMQLCAAPAVPHAAVVSQSMCASSSVAPAGSNDESSSDAGQTMVAVIFRRKGSLCWPGGRAASGICCESQEAAHCNGCASAVQCDGHAHEEQRVAQVCKQQQALVGPSFLRTDSNGLLSRLLSQVPGKAFIGEHAHQ